MRPTAPEPCVLVIFGAGGDLTKRLLAPSLYNLRRAKRLPEDFAVIGFARTDVGGEEGFRKKFSDDLKEFVGKDVDAGTVDWLTARLSYVRSAFDNQTGYEELKQKLAGKPQNYLFYLATAPEYFAEIPRQLHTAGLTEECGGKWRRVIVEKPFGRDLPSARKLNQDLAAILKEEQIYRIDHYLGKETVQNIMVMRFGNSVFEPLWNRRYIDHVQITVAEKVGVETRGGYYETAGALRDMVPNHIMQLVSLAAMEPPNSFDANAVRTEQLKALQAIAPLKPEEVARGIAVRGQYGPGIVDGKPVPGYRDEPRVAKDSPVETFVAMKLVMDNWRWAGVPFYLRTGKRMAERTTEMTIQFRPAPFVLFRDTPVEQMRQNCLVLQLQPNEGISLEVEAKVPGPEIQMSPVEMKFAYADYFGKSSNTGYETLLFDCMIGDQTLFKTAEAVEAGWAVVQPVLDEWAHKRPEVFPNYPVGSWGPECATELMARDGRRWRK
jgi:glucose-6-phosphate 1-dehydrogenase